ncbi:MarR family transcriptional regulator [Hazenella sp. IB182357]|uniref:MarR family transcriptional regulator n=1 Tax=Polycladospora coralii TaxID=2771432 RepID=A0A926RTG9_9BACL|nr:MarR family transcriptional regulator [Polycladospora coralii]MBD1372810.1 MarR family transcriptional regulator [Polycladospora coralii]MBS7529492.1 MarR family transcriptional regulator [Polycladospora coralii]
MSNRLDALLELEQAMIQFTRQIRKDLNKICGEDLTGAEFGILIKLQQNNPQIVSALSQDFEVSASHITHVADQLELKGLAVRKRCLTDKRVVELHITEKGLILSKELSNKKTQYFHQNFGHLTTEEIMTLLSLIQKSL